MYLYGKNSVLERITADPKSIKNIFLQDNFKDKRLFDEIKKAAIPVKTVNERKLSSIKRADRLQGIVAEVKNFSYRQIDELLYNSKKLSLIFLDQLNDPHNLGSIIRIAACAGGFGIVIPRHECCEVNDTVMHVASGGENYVPVAMVTNLSNALIKAKKAGFWVAGAEVEGGQDIDGVSLPFPLCLVLGSEGKGIRYGVGKHLDMKLTLPMGGAPLSYNVATACAIFCYEIARQKRGG